MRDPLIGAPAWIKTKRGLAPTTTQTGKVRVIGIGRHAHPYLTTHDCWTDHRPRHCAANGTEPCTHTHAEPMSATCHTCQRALANGQEAWADDWMVADVEGAEVRWRNERRYTCDSCHDAEASHV